MKTFKKQIINISVIFTGIWFVSYLLLSAASFFGYCIDMDCCTFHRLVLTVLIAAAATNGVCIFKMCCRFKR